MADADRQRTAAKLQFFDALSQARELEHVDTRIAWRLLSYLNSETGLAWPSYDTLASEAHVTRRTAIRSIDRLVAHGWFVKLASKGGRWFEGRGQPNHYRPNWLRVTPASPLEDEQEPLGAADHPTRVTTETNKGDTRNIKGDTRDNQGCHPCHPNPLMNPTNEPYDPNPSTPRARAREAGAGEGEGEGSGVKAGTSPPPVQAETPEAAWQGAEPEGDTRIRELAAQGYSQREIAQEVGCSRQPVEDVLAGIKRNSCEKGQPEPEPEPDDDAAVFDSTSADDRVNEAISTAWQTLVKELGGGRLMEVVDMDMLERAREAEQAQSGAGRMQLMSEARRAAERASEAAE